MSISSAQKTGLKIYKVKFQKKDGSEYNLDSKIGDEFRFMLSSSNYKKVVSTQGASTIIGEEVKISKFSLKVLCAQLESQRSLNKLTEGNPKRPVYVTFYIECGLYGVDSDLTEVIILQDAILGETYSGLSSNVESVDCEFSFGENNIQEVQESLYQRILGL